MTISHKKSPHPQVNYETPAVNAPLTIAHALCIIEQSVATAFNVAIPELRAATRSRAEAALARQAAMYLAHIGFGFTFTQIGALFGRDRTTVAHGCALVEDLRDDPVLDQTLTVLEKSIRASAAAL